MPEPKAISISADRSALKDFLASLATIRGDVSNITAPPFVLSPKSTVELPAFWAERPAIFCAPASSPNPRTRALLVLKWFLSSLRNQQYAGRDPRTGVKKPLNAFLGEIFLARWEDELGTTRLVSEQVSHHPPVTACRVWNEEKGVYAEGFTRQEITFAGTVNIRQMGHAVLTLEEWGEKYLVPLPDVKVSGILTGTPYPELRGTYYIPSTSGFVSRVDFEGKSLLGSSDKKHRFEAKLYREGEEEKPFYTVSGNWDSMFMIRDEQRGEDVDSFDAANASVAELKTEPIEEMDEWETRKAWKGVREALDSGDMQGTSDAKNVVEEGQRQMRKDEERDGKTWQRLFYRDAKRDEAAEILASKIGKKIVAEDTVGIWSFDEEAWKRTKKPFHGGLRPDNKQKQTQDLSQKEAKSITAGATEPDVRQQQSLAAHTSVNGIVHPPLAPEVQQKDVEKTKLESRVAGMNIEEQSAVEEMLRNRYLSG